MEHTGIIEREIDELISKNKFEDALEYIEKKMKESNDIRIISLCMYERARIEITIGKIEEGENDLSKTIDLLYYISDENFRGRLQMYIAGLYLYEGDMDNAIRMYQEAKKNLSRGSYDYLRLLNNIGEVYKRIGEIEKALKYFEKCYRESINKGHYKIGGYAAENIAEIYALREDRKKVEKFLKESLDLFKKVDDKKMINYISLALSILGNDRENAENLKDELIKMGFPHDAADAYYFFSEFAEDELRNYLLKDAVLMFSELGDGYMREKALEKMERKG